jgi:hypothetical protein
MKFRWLAACLLLLSGLAWGQAASHGGPDAGAAASTPEAQRGERERLVQARAAQQARWAEREQACGQLFWVNSCLRQAKLEHRRAMSEIERQQTRLESDIRQRRASEVAQRMHSRAQERTDRPTEREQRQIGADDLGVPAGQAQPEPVQPVQPQEQADQQLAQRQEQRQLQASERLLKQEQRQEQASARTQRREQSAQAAQAAQAARLERYAQRAAASDEAPP